MKEKMWAMLLALIMCLCIGALVACKPVVDSSVDSSDGGQEEIIDPKKGPEFGKVWFFAGQDMDAVGGLSEYGYDKGYVDYFGVPMGITTYTSISAGNALLTLSNGTSGDMCVQYYLDSEKFDGCLIHLSVQFGSAQGILDNIVNGVYDEQIAKIHETLVYGADHTFFLRLGYEFDLASYNYDPTKYAAAFRYIVDALREYGDTNFVTCWASHGAESGNLESEEERLLQYYPGDEYVDWMGYSYFINSTGDALRSLAYQKNKPVFIAESTPKGTNMESEDGEYEWYDGWFKNFFEHIETNIATIKAVAYINQNWDAQVMWEGQGWGNTRLQANEVVRQEWAEKISAEDNIFVHKKVEITDKEYVPDVIEVIEEPITTGTCIEAEWGSFESSSEVVEREEASNGKYVALQEGESIILLGVPAGKGMEIAYSSETDGNLTVEIVGKGTYTVPFLSSEGYMDLIYLMDESDAYYPISEVSTLIIRADSDVYVDAVYVKPDKGVSFKFGMEQIDALPDSLKNGAIEFSDGGVVGSGVQLSGANGNDLGSATFIAPCDGNMLGICYTRGNTKTRNLTLTINGEKKLFANSPTGSWNSYSCVFVEIDIKANDEIIISREALNQSAVNIDGIYVFDKGIFNGSVALAEKEFLSDAPGSYLSPAYALIENAEIGDDGKVLLDQEGAKITWASLNENSSITLVYSASQNGNISVDINGVITTVAFEKTDLLNPVKALALRNIHMPKDGYVAISYVDAPIKVKNVVLGGYATGSHAADVTAQATVMWQGRTPGSAYPDYDYTANIGNALVIESTVVSADTFVIVAAGKDGGETSYSVTIGDKTYSVKVIYNGWSKFYATYLVAESVPAGSKVTISVSGGANVHAVYGMNSAVFKEIPENVEVEEDLLFNNISGAYLKAEMGVLTGATLNGKNAVLDAVGESIEWHNLPSYKDFYVVYKANTAGTIKAYYGSNYEQFYAFPVSATNGEYATAYLAIGSKPSEKAAIPAGQSIKIVFEEGNVAVEIREIILMGYIHSADQSVTQTQSESIFTPANAETSDYPAYTNVNNTTLELTVTEKANAIMVVLMAKADLTVNFTLTYNGKEYEGKMIGSGWNTAKLVFITMDEYVEAGGSVSLKIDNNTNVCAIYAMDTASFKGNFEDVEVEEDLLFDNISGAYLKAEMGVLTGATLNGKNAVLDAVGESVEWHNLPSYKDFYVVYKANTAGTIKVYYGSNYEQFYAFPVSATNGEYVTAYLAIGSKPSEKAAIPAGQSIKIVFEEGNVAVTVKSIILMGYIHSADQSVTQAQSESIFTPANAETSDYPAYTNVNNKTLELTVTEKANAIMVVLMAKADLTVNFTLTYNGKEYEGKMIGSGWSTAKLVFITMDEYVEAGGSVSLKIDNNTNVCAIYAMDTADFKTVE